MTFSKKKWWQSACHLQAKFKNSVFIKTPLNCHIFSQPLCSALVLSLPVWKSGIFFETSLPLLLEFSGMATIRSWDSTAFLGETRVPAVMCVKFNSGDMAIPQPLLRSTEWALEGGVQLWSMHSDLRIVREGCGLDSSFLGQLKSLKP